jgi:hypothetical protein
MVVLLTLICITTAGFALDRSGYFSMLLPVKITPTAIGTADVCQSLIEKAMRISGNYCDRVGADQVCYGNITLQAELAPNVTRRFSERGDTIDAGLLRQLSASPLDLNTNEWGIAIFKVLANLPRSLPGQLVTMIVFGNTTLEKGTENLESFYFSSEFGQIGCEQVPFDGILVNMPGGAGLRFTVNGTDLVLIGNTALRAARNRDMVVSLYSGSGLVASAGGEQYVGAGQQVTVPLGGPNGTDASGPPSTPAPLSADDLYLSCSLTGQACSSGDITPVAPDQARATVQSGVETTATITPTPPAVLSPTVARTSLHASTSTRLVLATGTTIPSRTPTPRPTWTRSSTPNPAFSPTKTRRPSSTPTGGIPPSSTSLPAATSTTGPLPTHTPTKTNAPPTKTHTHAPPPPTSTSVPTPACNVSLGSLVPDGADLSVEIINGNSEPSGTLTINHLEIWWVNNPTSQALKKVLLGGTTLWSGSDSVPTTRFPEEYPWAAAASKRQIPPESTKTLLVQFGTSPQDLSVAGHPRVHIKFNAGCEVDRAYP